MRQWLGRYLGEVFMGALVLTAAVAIGGVLYHVN